MALATRCTACSTVFRISTAQAAAKGGMVRCGICANVFNSLDALVRVEELDVVEEVIVAPPLSAAAFGDGGLEAPEDDASAATADTAAAQEVRRAADHPGDHATRPAVDRTAEVGAASGAESEPGSSADDAADDAARDAYGAAAAAAAGAGDLAASSQPPLPSPAPAAETRTPPLVEPVATPAPIAPSFAAIPPTADVQPVALSAPDAARTEPTFAEPGEDAIIREWWMPDPAPAERAPLSGPITPPYSGRPTETREPLSPLLSGRRDGTREDLRNEVRADGSTIDGTNPLFMRPDAEADRGSRALRWTLGTLSIVAVVALLAQLAYLGRDELAARWSPARPWLAAACRLLDCELAYPAHADAITIESATVQSSGPAAGPDANLYVLSALLRNRDSIDLRYPHLELVLTDLQDRPILRRDLRPEDYLGTGRPPTSGFAAQSELPIRLTFELDNLRFAGYRLNQFYP